MAQVAAGTVFLVAFLLIDAAHWPGLAHTRFLPV